LADFQGSFRLVHRAELRLLENLILASLITACNSALGRVVDQSELARCPRFESGRAAPVVLEVVPLVVPVVVVPLVVTPVVVVPVLVVLALATTCSPLRG